MIDQIKLALTGIFLVGTLGYIGWITYDRNHIRDEFSKYKEATNDQVQKAKIAAKQEKDRQDAKYAQAVNTYADTRRNLRIALERLRDAPAVLRERTVFVPVRSSDSVPSEAKDTEGTYTTFATRTGTCRADFYADAMMDIAQCKALIEFVR